MLRLRTTTSLSTLALLIGVAGTGWLSSLTSQWHEPSNQPAIVGRLHSAPRTTPKTHRVHGPVTVVATRVVSTRRAWRHDPIGPQAPRVTTAASPAALQPLATPDDTSQRWAQLRGHLDGRVIVHLRVDRAGNVDDASLVVSSGDPVLDQHALRSVRGWRFAVPADHPDGLTGDLPMRFSSQDRPLGVL
ncbi:MAG: TonB family protein [Rhodanobacter sp.]